jgi:hypothetical protein
MTGPEVKEIRSSLKTTSRFGSTNVQEPAEKLKRKQEWEAGRAYRKAKRKEVGEENRSGPPKKQNTKFKLLQIYLVMARAAAEWYHRAQETTPSASNPTSDHLCA